LFFSNKNLQSLDGSDSRGCDELETLPSWYLSERSCVWSCGLYWVLLSFINFDEF